jgi:hypothetical protein
VTGSTVSREYPDDPELEVDITGPQYGFSNKGAIQLEKKEDMKKRDLDSPDAGDMLAMTFGVNVLPKPPQRMMPSNPYGASGWMA